MKNLVLSNSDELSIPVAVREALKLQPGQEFQLVVYDGRLELIPVQPIQEMRGFLAGIDTEVEREEDRF
mgnify:CR=1 FL=1